VLTVDVSIVSLKLTDTVVLTDTPVAPLDGVVELTVGLVVSVTPLARVEISAVDRARP
jgi:hypothetical protein